MAGLFIRMILFRVKVEGLGEKGGREGPVGKLVVGFILPSLVCVAVGP